MEAKKTPLYHAFANRGANLVNAGGYFAPVAFTDPRTEHVTCREVAGLFEIFGQFLVEVSRSHA